MDAQAWAVKMEAKWQAFRTGLTPDIPLREILIRYHDEISPTKRGFKNETNIINHVLNTPLADVNLPDLCELQFKV